MLLTRFYHEGLAQASYLVGCQKTGEALVIDANRDAEQYLAAAAREGMRITHVTETHIHADYLSGSRELVARTGARLLLSAEGGSDWQYANAAGDGATLLRDGDHFTVGNLRLDVMHTPGHTPEHLVFILTDTLASPHPVGAFTGDFIFVGDVGRPDLLERAAHIEGTMRTGASQLFHSLRRFVARYPDFLQLWPGHGSGSACGKALGAVPQTTLGYEKVANWAMQLGDEETFIDAVLDGQPDPPRYFATMKRMNRAGPPVLGAAPTPPRLAPEQLDAALANGGIVVDLRAAAVAAEGFIPGTLNLPLNKSFVGWAGWLLDYDRDLFLLAGAPDDGAAPRAAQELAMIGLDRVVGWFGGESLTAWTARGRSLATVEQVDPGTVAEWLAGGETTVLDVRAANEWDSGHLDGAQLCPLGRLSEALPRLATRRRLVMQCQSGGRSAIAASLAHRAGIASVVNLRGGIQRWMEEARPVVGADVAEPALATSPERR